MSILVNTPTSPQMPCGAGTWLSGTAYTPTVEVMGVAKLQLTAGTVTNISLGLAIHSPSGPPSSAPISISVAPSENVALVSTPVDWMPIPGHAGYYHAHVAFWMQRGDVPTPYTLTSETTLGLPKGLLVLAHGGDSKYAGQPMHMVAGHGSSAIVAMAPTSPCSLSTKGPSKFQLTMADSAAVTTVKAWLARQFSPSTSPNQFFSMTQNGTPVSLPLGKWDASGHQMTFVFPTPLQVKAGDVLAFSGNYTENYFCAAPGDASKGAVVIEAATDGRVTRPGGTTSASELGSTYDPSTLFCDFFTGNPMLRSPTPAPACRTDACITFQNDPTNPAVAHLPNVTTIAIDAPIKEPYMHLIKVPHAHDASLTLEDTAGCNMPNFIPGQMCSTFTDCDKGMACCQPCSSPPCSATSGKTGYCYDPAKFTCQASTTNTPHVVPASYYFVSTPFGQPDTAFVTLADGYKSFDIPVGTAGMYACPDATNADQCCSAVVAQIESSCGTAERPGCPVGSKPTAISCQKMHMTDNSLAVQVAVSCHNPQFCLSDANCGTGNKCVGGYCTCSSHGDCGDGQSCNNGACFPTPAPGYVPWQGATARSLPVIPSKAAPYVSNCFPDKDLTQINGTLNTGWTAERTPPPPGVPYTIQPSGQKNSGQQGLLLNDTLAHTKPVGAGEYYLSQKAATTTSQLPSGADLGVSLLPYYKMCPATGACEKDRMTSLYLNGGNCVGSDPGNENSTAGTDYTPARQGGHYYFLN